MGNDSEDRSVRVFPLANDITNLLKLEADEEVQIAAFDVVKVYIEMLRYRVKINRKRKREEATNAK